MQRMLFLKNFCLPCFIGAFESERAQQQPVVLNLSLSLAEGWVARDCLKETVDYDQVRQRIASLVSGRHFNLQETLVQKIATLCFEQPDVVSLTVSSEKPAAYADCESAGYQLQLSRAEWEAWQ